MFDEVAEFLKLMNDLPLSLKAFYLFLFFGLPKVIQILGGGKVVRGSISSIWEFLVEVVRRYQSRKAQEIEDESLTEAYTRTLVIESLAMFGERLKRMDHKINHILLRLEPEAEIEVIEATSPTREYSDTVIHTKIRRKLEEMRKLREQN